jgi:glycosyltransferase involved in cell wall biosynthesis
MEEYKGLAVLLRAAESMHADRVPFELEIAGRGPELDRLERELTALPEVTVRNRFISATEIIESVQRTDYVVLPYLSATQSGVLAAAFAGGRGVIATSVGGLVDIVQHERNGLVVPPADPVALANAIRRLAGDEDLRARLLAGARATAGSRLNWTLIAAHVDEVISRVAERRNGWTELPAAPVCQPKRDI